MSESPKNEHRDQNQGEGNIDAARRFDAAERKFVESGKVEKAASDALRAVEGPEKAELKKAEDAGRAHAKS